MLCLQGDAAKIKMSVKFMMVAIWTKFDTPMQTEMPMTIRKLKKLKIANCGPFVLSHSGCEKS